MIFDQEKLDELYNLLIKQSELSQAYADARQNAAIARYKLYVVLTNHLPLLRQKKRNLGIEMAELMLLEEGYLEEEQRCEVLEYWHDYNVLTEKYKGLEKIIEANQSRIMFAQSLMKWVKQGESFG